MRRKSYNCLVTKCTKCKMFQSTTVISTTNSHRHDMIKLNPPGQDSRHLPIDRGRSGAGEISVGNENHWTCR
jgi:hypothetical protein